MSRIRAARVVARFGLLVTATAARAEPMFLSKQYTRCTTCHYSATGGGLLTPYGRSLSHRELSTTGADPSQPGPPPDAPVTGEEAFLYGALGNLLGPVQLGIDLRPSHLQFSTQGFSSDKNLWMTADMIAAYRVKGWTFYGEIGRQPTQPEAKVDSYEYWVGHQSDNGIGVRAGRFMPAYGIHLADHTAFSRLHLGFDSYDQVYGVEFSYAAERQLLQLSASPGRADSIINDDGRKAFTTTGRYQFDLGARSAVVVSGLYRDKSDLIARNGAGGVAFGFAPMSRLNTWTEVDTLFQQGVDGASYIVVNETAFEAYRGLWLKFSPQLRTVPGDAFTGQVRMLFEADLLPRTHWNVGASYYRDRSRASDVVTNTFLIQLHLYL